MIEHDRLEQHFRVRFPDRQDLSLVKHWRIVGGMSRETWFADLRWTEDGNERTERVTVRMDHEAGAVVPVPLWWEFRVLQGLHGTAVPVAAPLWFEDDPTILGRAPFYVRETVEGTASPKELYKPGQEALRARIGRQFAESLAALHTLDWRAAGFADFMEVPVTAEDCARIELRKYRDHMTGLQSEPLPALAELLTWLDREAPRFVDRVTLVWGDVGIGNFIFRDGDIVALTDWEQSHLGDPMKDWASGLWRAVDNLLPRDEMFSIYTEASGIPIDEERIRYYTAFIDAQYVCTSHPVLERFGGDEPPDVTFARLGLGIPWYCMDHGLRSIGA